jgi:hypothetical protein
MLCSPQVRLRTIKKNECDIEYCCFLFGVHSEKPQKRRMLGVSDHGRAPEAID